MVEFDPIPGQYLYLVGRKGVRLCQLVALTEGEWAVVRIWEHESADRNKPEIYTASVRLSELRRNKSFSDLSQAAGECDAIRLNEENAHRRTCV